MRRNDRQRALQSAVVAGLVPLILFGAFGAFASYQTAHAFKASGAPAGFSLVPLLFFAGFGVVCGLVFGALAGLGASVLPAASRRIDDRYAEFARRVNGRLVTQQVTGRTPAVDLSDDGRPVRL